MDVIWESVPKTYIDLAEDALNAAAHALGVAGVDVTLWGPCVKLL